MNGASKSLAAAFHTPLSFHCAPTLHAAVAGALPGVVHGEYFHDHARIEHMFFEGAPSPVSGTLAPDRQRPGLGLEFRRADAEKCRVS